MLDEPRKWPTQRLKVNIRLMLAWIVLLGQIAVTFVVVSACAQSIITSSLLSTKTMEAAIDAFFVLEIDDKWVSVGWNLIPHAGAIFCKCLRIQMLR